MNTLVSFLTTLVLCSCLLVSANPIEHELEFVGKVMEEHRMTAVQIEQYKKNWRNNPRPDFMPTGKKPQPSSAGMSTIISSQIIGGDVATTAAQFPWQALIVIDGVALCGGSLITTDFVLTAAHCAVAGTKFLISLGGVNRKANETGEQFFETTQVFPHEKYNYTNLNNDIAVMKLPRSVTLSSTINVIRLPSTVDANKPFYNVAATASGYGKTSQYSGGSTTLKYASLLVIRNSKCATYYGSEIVISSTLCTSEYKNKNICSGDSGGPLVYKESDGAYTQIGIVSFSASTSCVSFPAGYCRVTSFLGWISKQTGVQIRKK